MEFIFLALSIALVAALVAILLVFSGLKAGSEINEVNMVEKVHNSVCKNSCTVYSRG